MLLADDRAAARETLAFLLAADGRAEVLARIELPGAAAGADRTRPDVVVLAGAERSVERVAEAVLRLLALPSRPEVVVLGANGDPRMIGGVLDAGASAYVSERAPLGELMEAVRAAAGDGSGRSRGERGDRRRRTGSPGPV